MATITNLSKLDLLAQARDYRSKLATPGPFDDAKTQERQNLDRFIEQVDASQWQNSQTMKDAATTIATQDAAKGQKLRTRGEHFLIGGTIGMLAAIAAVGTATVAPHLVPDEWVGKFMLAVVADFGLSAAALTLGTGYNNGGVSLQNGAREQERFANAITFFEERAASPPAPTPAVAAEKAIR